MLDDLADRLHAIDGKETSPQHAARVSVSKHPPQVTVDGFAIALSQNEVDCISPIVEADGDWVPGVAISKATEEPRPDRVLKGVAKRLGERRFFESAPGKGTRLLPKFRKPLA